MKTCDKLGVSFWDYLGSRLDIPGAPPILPLPDPHPPARRRLTARPFAPVTKYGVGALRIFFRHAVPPRLAERRCFAGGSDATHNKGTGGRGDLWPTVRTRPGGCHAGDGAGHLRLGLRRHQLGPPGQRPTASVGFWTWRLAIACLISAPAPAGPGSIWHEPAAATSRLPTCRSPVCRSPPSAPLRTNSPASAGRRRRTGTALPFRDASFDAISHSDVLCCLADKGGGATDLQSRDPTRGSHGLQRHLHRARALRGGA